jgi:hypothetical protein
MSNKAAAKLKCLQSTDMHQEVSQEMIKNLVMDLQNSTAKNIQDKLEANAKAQTEQGALSLAPPPNSESATKIKNSYQSVTETNKNIENIMENVVTNEFKDSDFKSCVGNASSENAIRAVGAEFGSDGVTIKDIKMENVIENIVNCEQMTKSLTNIVNKAADALGVKIKEDETTVKTTDVKATAESTAKATGVFQDIGNAISGIMGSFFTGVWGILAIVAVVIIFIIMFFGKDLLALFTGGALGGSDEEGDEESDYMYGGGFNKLNSSSVTSLSGLSSSD